MKRIAPMDHSGMIKLRAVQFRDNHVHTSILIYVVMKVVHLKDDHEQAQILMSYL